ncbi:ornithine carbamoyltransferase [Tundrisphaera lichenicola]|uniref:ornithine carbamoyltransferase n=1 Tax=Tundrisphaera lichenicola TaxID=2029860 RepID=UPI003EB82E3A
MVRHFIDLFDITADEAATMLDRAASLKSEDRRHGARSPMLAGRTLGLVFDKPSLRTRVSFEAAITQLGGNAIFLNGKDVGLGVRESVADFARVISQYVDALAVRTFSQTTIEELGRHATIPIINALSDASHPCQALADLLTVLESLGELKGLKFVFVGDGNNVARSLAQASAMFGVDFVLACPPGYEYPAAFASKFAEAYPGVPLTIENDPSTAVTGADVIYTDVWASMGQEDEVDSRKTVFAPYRVDEGLLALAKPGAIFLHCLPARRGEEVTDEVLDGPQSRVVHQAANRLHFQKALLVWLLHDNTTEGESVDALLNRFTDRASPQVGNGPTDRFEPEV